MIVKSLEIMWCKNSRILRSVRIPSTAPGFLTKDSNNHHNILILFMILIFYFPIIIADLKITPEFGNTLNRLSDSQFKGNHEIR